MRAEPVRKLSPLGQWSFIYCHWSSTYSGWYLLLIIYKEQKNLEVKQKFT